MDLNLAKSDFDNICRCCLSSQKQGMSLINAWHLDIYCAITSLQFIMEDSLPKLICEQCTIEMDRIKKFADVCKESNARLNKIMNKKGTETEIDRNRIKIEAESDIGVAYSEDVYRVIYIKKDVNIIDEKHVLSVEEIKKELSSPNDIKHTDFETNHPKNKHELSPKSKNKKHPCDECSKSFTTSSKLIRHKLSHLKAQENKTFKPRLQNTCYTCKTRFASAADRNQHYKDSDICKPKQFVCEICNKSVSNLYKLKIHQVTHTEDRTFACKICGKSFKHFNNWKWHEKMHDKEEHDKHICNVCEKGFPLPCLLKLHEETHTASGSYICDLCGKTCTSKLQFRTHKLTHVQKTPKTTLRDQSEFLCSECGKTFGTKYNLQQHVRLHTGEKPYKCVYCSKTFPAQANLCAHVNIHLGLRPHKCDLCNKTFRHAHHLKAHKLSHSGAKPYECDICQNKFVSAANLKLHKLIHSGDTPLKCPHCDVGFGDYKARRGHIKLMHGVISLEKIGDNVVEKNEMDVKLNV